MERHRLVAAVLFATPMLLALLAVPAGADAPTVTVTNPRPDQVVAGRFVFQGTAGDADANLRRVEISLEDAATIWVSLPLGPSSVTWEEEWNSRNVPDGSWDVSVIVRDRDGESSQYVNFTLLIDNEKEPQLQEDPELLFDLDGVGAPIPWENRSAVPTTGLTFELRFSEEMEEASVRNAIRFLGGPASWDLSSADGVAYQLNVSYLQAGTEYDFVLGTRATDVAGNPLVAGYALSFRTSAQATPGTPAGPPFGGFVLPVDPTWIWLSGGGLAAAIGAAWAWRRGLFTRLAAALRRFRRGRE